MSDHFILFLSLFTIGQADIPVQNATNLTFTLFLNDTLNETLITPNSTYPTPMPKRPIVCCPPTKPCRHIFWPISMEKGVHAPLTDHFGLSFGSIFRSRFDNENEDEDECNLIRERTNRGQIIYRLPPMISHWNTFGRWANGNRKMKINVYTFQSSFDYYLFILKKITSKIDIDLGFIDFYTDQMDFLDLLKRVITVESAWLRIEVKIETSRYGILIDGGKSIFNKEFMRKMNRLESSNMRMKNWFDLFHEFGTHFPIRGTLGGMYAFSTNIDCDRSWAADFDTLKSLQACFTHLIEKNLFNEHHLKLSISPSLLEMCDNITSTVPIHGYSEISGGSDRTKSRIIGENNLQDAINLLQPEWAQSIRDRPALINAELKPICDLIHTNVLSSDQIEKRRNSCYVALGEYKNEAKMFTGIVIDEKGEIDNEKYKCSDQQKMKHLRVPKLEDEPDEEEWAERIIVAVKYEDENICVRIKKLRKEENRKFHLCPTLKRETAAVVNVDRTDDETNLPVMTVLVLVLAVVAVTVFALFGVLRTLPAF